MRKKFDGPDYFPKKDYRRLQRQHATIFSLMSDKKWRSLREIEKLTGYTTASISAQLRHMRKERFGSHTVDKQNHGGGLFKYKLIRNKKPMGVKNESNRRSPKRNSRVKTRRSRIDKLVSLQSLTK